MGLDVRGALRRSKLFADSVIENATHHKFSVPLIISVPILSVSGLAISALIMNMMVGKPDGLSRVQSDDLLRSRVHVPERPHRVLSPTKPELAPELQPFYEVGMSDKGANTEVPCTLNLDGEIIQCAPAVVIKYVKVRNVNPSPEDPYVFDRRNALEALPSRNERFSK